MGRKLLMSFALDEQALKRVFGSRRNPVAVAEWVHVQCKHCGSQDVFRYGFDKRGKQRFVCNVCKRTFIDNKAPARRRFPSEAIALALNMFYESASLAKIQRQIDLTYGVKPDRMTVHRWITDYSRKASKALNDVPIKAGSKWVADETVIRLKEKGGSKGWFWDIIDDKTRFLLASHLSESRKTSDAQTLMERASKRANRVPAVVVTDKLASYVDGIELAFGGDTQHRQAKKLASSGGTQLIERFHSTLKDRTKVFRSFFGKRSATTVLAGWLVHYNYFRPHSSLNGKTPAEAAGVQSPFKNWGDVVRGEENGDKGLT